MKKINKTKLMWLVQKLINWKPEEIKDMVMGSYIFKGFRIQISRYGESTSQRVMNLYRRRRAAGECIQCGEKVKKKNPRTKKLYRLCEYHREKIDKKVLKWEGSY